MRPKVVLCLGQIAWNGVLAAIRDLDEVIPRMDEGSWNELRSGVLFLRLGAAIGSENVAQR